MKADEHPAGMPDDKTKLGELLDAFHLLESTALQLRELTLTRSTAGAIKAVHRDPTPELVELLERYEQAVERLQMATGAETVQEAREIGRVQRHRLRSRARRASEE